MEQINMLHAIMVHFPDSASSTSATAPAEKAKGGNDSPADLTREERLQRIIHNLQRHHGIVRKNIISQSQHLKRTITSVDHQLNHPATTTQSPPQRQQQHQHETSVYIHPSRLGIVPDTISTSISTHDRHPKQPGDINDEGEEEKEEEDVIKMLQSEWDPRLPIPAYTSSFGPTTSLSAEALHDALSAAAAAGGRDRGGGDSGGGGDDRRRDITTNTTTNINTSKSKSAAHVRLIQETLRVMYDYERHAEESVGYYLRAKDRTAGGGGSGGGGGVSEGIGNERSGGGDAVLGNSNAGNGTPAWGTRGAGVDNAAGWSTAGAEGTTIARTGTPMEVDRGWEERAGRQREEEQNGWGGQQAGQREPEARPEPGRGSATGTATASGPTITTVGGGSYEPSRDPRLRRRE